MLAVYTLSYTFLHTRRPKADAACLGLSSANIRPFSLSFIAPAHKQRRIAASAAASAQQCAVPMHRRRLLGIAAAPAVLQQRQEASGAPRRRRSYTVASYIL
jgi:hypothetical protein